MPAVLRCCRPLVAGLMLLLAACAGKEEETYLERPVDELYNLAMDRLQEKDYAAAAKAFDEVERQHPYSTWATKAQMMAAFAHYENNKYDDAIVALDRFIQLHPSNRDAPYAFYLKALSYYEQIADVGRDQKTTDEALKALQEVVDRFPESSYARDAKLKVDLARDHLAGKEMTVGRYYHRQKHYLAAINRYKSVLQHFQTTTHVPEALHRLVECYLALGLAEEANRTAAVLGHNYPGSVWYRDAYQLVSGGPTEPVANRGWFGLW